MSLLPRVIALPLTAYRRLRLHRYRRAGLQAAPDVRIIGTPRFGSEPYLISIGRHVTVSNDVSFITHDGATWVVRHLPGHDRLIKYGRIDILDNCFIGMGAIILPGVRIGPNSVVAAGSVVVRDVAPGTIVAGNPARVVTTVEEYAARALADAPEYDREAELRDKRAELTRIMPPPEISGDGTATFAQGRTRPGLRDARGG